MRPGRALATHLPDLGRLLLCPTGGTNDAEAGPSSQRIAGPTQRHALSQSDVVRSILLSLAGGDPEEACRAAARWCMQNRAHKQACDEGGWAQLTEAVFPDARARPQDDRNVSAEDWFFHLCHEHQHGRKVREWREAVDETDAAEEARRNHRRRDDDARRLSRNYAKELRAVNAGVARTNRMKAATDEYAYFLALEENLNLNSESERKLSALTERAFQVLVKSATPEYWKTPLRNMYKKYTNQIQLLRFEIFEMRYYGKTLATDELYFMNLASELKEMLDKLEALMELSKKQGEEAARL